MLIAFDSISAEEAAESICAAHPAIFSTVSRSYLMPYLRRLAGDLLRKYSFYSSDWPLQLRLPELYGMDWLIFGAISFLDGKRARWCLCRKASRTQLEGHLAILKEEERALAVSMMRFEMFVRELNAVAEFAKRPDMACGDIVLWLDQNIAEWRNHWARSDDDADEVQPAVFAAQCEIMDGGDWQ
jgi:hypothetical protein